MNELMTNQCWTYTTEQLHKVTVKQQAKKSTTAKLQFTAKPT